jgi:hypothetical protein
MAATHSVPAPRNAAAEPMMIKNVDPVVDQVQLLLPRYTQHQHQFHAEGNQYEDIHHHPDPVQ